MGAQKREIGPMCSSAIWRPWRATEVLTLPKAYFIGLDWSAVFPSPNTSDERVASSTVAPNGIQPAFFLTRLAASWSSRWGPNFYRPHTQKTEFHNSNHFSTCWLIGYSLHCHEQTFLNCVIMYFLCCISFHRYSQLHFRKLQLYSSKKFQTHTNF